MHILNKVFERIFVINLDRCPDRREYIQQQLNGIGYEFIRGVDGMNIDMEKLISEGVWNRPACHRALRRDIHMGEVGCAMSHRMIYEKMVAENISNALILEDDIKIYRDNIEQHFEQAFSQLPAAWDLVYLGYQQESRLKYSMNLRRALIHDGAFSYAVSLKGVKKIIKQHTPLFHNADGALNVMCQQQDFSAFLISPRLIEYTQKFKSSVWYD
jgi:glycosyl transferase family 25